MKNLRTIMISKEIKSFVFFYNYDINRKIRIDLCEKIYTDRLVFLIVGSVH